MVTEYIPNGYLMNEVMKRNYLAESQAAYVIKQLISAMKYSHDKGVAHRNIRPENVLVKSISEDDKIEIKITNFYEMSFLPSNIQPYETLNTIYYLAPETLLGISTEKCDLWSIGVITYLLISGILPFYGTNDEVLEAIRKGTFSFTGSFKHKIGKIWNDVSDASKNFIKKLITYDVDKRISSNDAFKDQWIQAKVYGNLCEPSKFELINNMRKNYVILLRVLANTKTAIFLYHVHRRTINNQARDYYAQKDMDRNGYK